MADLAKLVVKLEAQSSKLQAGLEKAEKRASRWEKRTKGNVLNVKQAFVGLGLGIAAVKFKNFVTENLAAADSIGKTADKLGISTSALQEYRFAAEQSGVATNVLDMGMQRFTRRVAEAQAGQGELRQTLEQLNISLRDSQGNVRTSEAIFYDYADAIKNAESKQERLRLAFKGFDSEGAALVNMLRNGSEGVQAFSKEARDLGIVVDEKLIRQSEQATDKINILSRVMKAEAMVTVANYAGEIQSLVKTLLDFSRVAAKVPDFVKYLSESFAAAINGPADPVRIGDKIKVLESQLFSFNLSLFKMKEQAGVEGFVHSAIFGKDEEALRAKIKQTEAEIKALQARLEMFQVTLPPQPKPIKPPEENKRDVITYKPPAEQLQIVDELLRGKLERIETSLMTEESVIAESYSRRQNLLDSSLERELISKEKHAKLSAALKQKEADAIVAIESRRIQITAGLLDNLSQLVGGKSKKQFEFAKKLSMASTVMNTYAGARAAFAQTPGPVWVKAAAAASAVAAGLADLRRIENTRFESGGSGGGGGAPSIGSGGASSAQLSSDGGETTTTARAESQSTIILVGLSEAEMDSVLDRAEAQINEGSRVIIRRDSPQAQEIMRAARS